MCNEQEHSHGPNNVWLLAWYLDFYKNKKKYERASECKFLKMKQHMDRIQRENKEPQSQPNFTQSSIMIKLKKNQVYGRMYSYLQS